MTAKKLFVFMAIAAFLSVISFFQINSAVGDKYHINGLFTFFGVGFAVLAVILLINVVKRSN